MREIRKLVMMCGIALSGSCFAGAKVAEIKDNSIYQKMGLESGDEVVAVDGIPVESFFDLVRTTKGKQNFKLKIKRDGESKEIKVELDSGR